MQKAYDSVEYPVLLEKLYEVGINGKLWRVLKNWYLGGRCKVRLDGICSEGFEVERGVKQGSVLSPVLFVIVMDPLLKLLEESSLGLSVNEFYAGGFLHADDIRTLATSIVQQAELVAATNFLKLNVDKCEVIVFGATAGWCGSKQLQRRATKFIIGNSSSAYKSRLLELELLPLMMLYELNDTMFFITNVRSPSESFNILQFVAFSTTNTRSGTSKLFHTRPLTNSHRHFYFQRLVKL